jgi:hypothetical protein
MSTPVHTGGGGKAGDSFLVSPSSQTKRKRDLDQFSTKRSNKSPMVFDGKSRVKTIKKVESISREELSGYELLYSGELICLQSKYVISYVNKKKID